MAGPGLLAIAAALGRRLPAGPGEWRAVVLLGLLNRALYLGVTTFAIDRLDAGMSAVPAREPGQSSRLSAMPDDDARRARKGDIVPIDYQKLLRFPIPEIANTWTERDTMLYALAVGMAADPVDPRELAFVLEADGRPLRVLPTMSTVLVWNDAWMYESGIDMTKQLHGEQRIRIHRPLPPAATVVGRTRITDVFDKGPGKGALMLFETEIRDQATGTVLATNVATSYAQGEGGFGGPAGSGPAPHPIPARAPDATYDQRTLPTQALLYRLCGDRNLLHADPEYAQRGGFPRPILHGLCTLGHACAAVVRKGCDYDPARVETLAVRFTRPVFPGETIRTEMWTDGGVISFRSRVVERDAIVLDHGRVDLAAST